MVERKLTSETKSFRKTGVVIIILNQEGQILTFLETAPRDTDGSSAGNFSVTCETTNPGENWADTVIRGLKEELGGEMAESGVLYMDPDSSFLGESLFSPNVLARVVVLYYTPYDNQILNADGDGETIVVGWASPNELLRYPLRPGVKKILQECLANGCFPTRPSLDTKLLPLSAAALRESALRLTSTKIAV